MKHPEQNRTWIPMENRQRMHNIIDYALQRKVVLMTGNHGMGKTAAVISYLACNPELMSVYLHLTSTNCHRERFWKLLTDGVARWNIDLAERMRQMGFPFLKDMHGFFQKLKDGARRAGGAVLVLDNFDLLPDGPVKAFVMTMIERTHQAVSYILMGGEAMVVQLPNSIIPSYITNNELSFTRDELFSYYAALGVGLEEQSNRELIELTGGWPTAIHLMSVHLARGLPLPVADHSGGSLSAVQTIIEELIQEVSEPVKQALILLSHLEEISPELVERATGIDREAFLAIVENSPFCHTHGGTHSITNVFRSHLAAKWEQVPPETRHDFLCAVAQWYEEQEQALAEPPLYYCRAGEYGKALAFLRTRNLSRLSFDLCGMYEELLYKLPDQVIREHRMLWLLRILFRMNGTNEAKAWSELSALEAAIFAAGGELSAEDRQILGECRMLNALLKLYRGKGSFLALIQEATNLIPQGSVIWAGSNAGSTINSTCIPQGHGVSMMEFVELYRQAAPLLRVLMHHGEGLEHLIACEAYYYRGDLEVSMAYTKLAIQSAVDHGQWEVAACASFFGVRSSLALGQLFDLETYMEKCHEYARKGRDHGQEYLLIDDIANWFLACHLEQSGMIADWIKEPFDMRMLRYIPNTGREFFPVVSQLSQDGKTHEALELANAALEICNLNGKWPTILYLRLIKALIYEKMSEIENAAKQLHICYLIARDDNVIMPFVDMGTRLGRLIRKIRELPETMHDLPPAWLDDIEKHASAFGSHVMRLRSDYVKTHRNNATAMLSEREMEAFSKLCAGMRMKEIASGMGIADSTLKVTLFHAYKKMGVRNMEEAKQLAFRAFMS